MKTVQELIRRYGPAVLRDFEAAARRFAQENTDVTALAVAENVLLESEMLDRLHALPRMQGKDLMYQDSYGSQELRDRAAVFVNRTLGLENDAPLHGGLVSGFSSTRAVLLRLLEPLIGSDKPMFLVPTPCWQGFHWVLEDALGGHIVRVPSSSADGFQLSLAKIQVAYRETMRRTGREPLALVLTNPGNPVGRNIPRQQLDEITAWVLGSTRMHLVSDEIYAHSQVKAPSVPFTSVLALPQTWENDLQNRVHVAWGYAKDFGLSGFRIGLYLCRDAATQDRARANAQWSPFDSYNAFSMSEVMGADGGQGAALMDLLRERLTLLYPKIGGALATEGIPSARDTDAALFFWLDLRKWLPLAPAEPCKGMEVELLDVEDSQETRLRQYLVCEAKVDIAPGTQFLFSEPGYFRMCYTAAPEKNVLDAVVRMGKALRALG